MTRMKAAKACRACGLDGRTYYMDIMGKKFPLCNGCRSDYLSAETKCDLRAMQRERKANKRAAGRAGEGPKPTDPFQDECPECSGEGVCANCNGTGESDMECAGCGGVVTNADVEANPEAQACRKCVADDEKADKRATRARALIAKGG